MKIPSDSPTTIHTARSGALQALGLRPGQTFTAQVISHTPEGLTNLQVGNQQLSLALPSKAQLGILLKFEFQSSGAKPQITLLGEIPTTKPAAPPSAELAIKTTNIQTPNQKPTQHQTYQNPNPRQNPNIQTSTPTIPTQTTSSSNSPQTTTTPLPAQTTNTQSNISIPIPPATKAALKLYPSQTISATVIASKSDGQTLLQIGQQQFSVNIPNNPSNGTKFQFQLQNFGDQTRLVMTNPPTTNPTQATAKPTNISNINITNSKPTPQLQTQNTAQNNTTTQTAPIQNPIAQAISQAIPTNIAMQDSITALFTNIANLTKEMPNLPPTIIKSAKQLQSAQLNFDSKMPTAQNLQTAIKQSGVFMEAVMSNIAQNPNAQNSAILTSTTQSDLKLLLLLFRGTLKKWLGDQSNPQKPNTSRPNPPTKGAIPRSNAPPTQAQTTGQSTQQLGQTLLSQTEAALSRLRLFQMTSLPEASARSQALSSQETNLELPFIYNGETNLIRFQLSKDANNNDLQGDNSWQIRFSTYLEEIGEVGADVAFRYKKINATIWADKEETANSLEKTLPLLNEALTNKGLELGSIHIRHGAPKPTANKYGANL